MSNCQFVYPLSASPILRAFTENNTHFVYQQDRNGISINGDINIRSGELYYIQKYFYVTEGNLHFEQTTSGFNPLINLRARLRDFDSEGEQVDIYLILRDSTLNNLNPTFESTPAKDLNEIMQILGQAILPTNAYGQVSLASVASLLSASVDVLSRVGIIGGGETGLDESIRQSLSLDIFSLHSNIISNIITDTISLGNVSSGANNYSPMARYLNGTSIYIGKYLTPDIYLQGLLHLVAENNPSYDSFTFISNDLVLDMELSLEWSNPLCTVNFFTKPVNMTLYSLFDGFGFTLSKRLTF